MHQDRGRLTKLAEILALSRKRAQQGHLSVSRQLLEMTVLALTRRMGPGYYHTAGYWRTEVPWKEKTGQLDAAAYRRVLQRLNPMSYRKITQHKVSEKAVLTLFGVPTPRFIGLLCPKVGRDSKGNPLRSYAELDQLLRAEAVPGIVFKEVEGHGGKGVRPVILKFGPTITCHTPGQPETAVPLEQLVEQDLLSQSTTSWLVEEYFEQHTVLRGLNPTSVNTVRAWVLRRGDDEPAVVNAYLRIGRGGMSVDNASSGGIVAPIDLGPGRLRAAQDATAERGHYPLHPDHGAPIEGTCIPYWADVMAIAKMALTLFPKMRFAGLDVAVGPDGPVIIELNVQPDREGAAFTGYSSKDLMRTS